MLQVRTIRSTEYEHGQRDRCFFFVVPRDGFSSPRPPWHQILMAMGIRPVERGSADHSASWANGMVIIARTRTWYSWEEGPPCEGRSHGMTRQTGRWRHELHRAQWVVRARSLARKSQVGSERHVTCWMCLQRNDNCRDSDAWTGSPGGGRSAGPLWEVRSGC